MIEKKKEKKNTSIISDKIIDMWTFQIVYYSEHNNREIKNVNSENSSTNAMSATH